MSYTLALRGAEQIYASAWLLPPDEAAMLWVQRVLPRLPADAEATLRATARDLTRRGHSL